jgi:hypothetical protein
MKCAHFHLEQPIQFPCTVWVENFEVINFRCFRGVSLDPQKLNTTNFDLTVQLLSRVTFQVLQACSPATMTGEVPGQLDTDRSRNT